jgi:hypothetical protein
MAPVISLGAQLHVPTETAIAALITPAIEVSELWQRTCLPAYRAVCKRQISEQTDAILVTGLFALFTPQQTKTESNK